MDTISVSAMHPNKQWFDTDDQAVLDDFADPDTATFLLRRHGRFQVKLPLNQEVIVGRCHSGKGPQPQVDLSPYKAAAYGTSRLHAALRHDAHGWWLEDLQSSNGTWVNGEQLKAYCPVHLDIRNRILLGNLPLSILLPHKVFSGVVMPVNFDQTMPTHVVNIEGDTALQRILQVTFQAAEPTINLHHFATGDEAMPYIEANAESIDLFILDMTLTGTMNGLEVASRIRALGCPGSIIFTSADTSPSGQVLESLNSAFLPKPSHILEIAPQLFNYRLSLKTRPEHHTEPPITLEDSVAIGKLQQPNNAAPIPEAQAVLQQIPEAYAVDTAPETVDVSRFLTEEPDPAEHDSGETKPPIIIDDSRRITRFKVPINYLQRIITAIRRL